MGGDIISYVTECSSTDLMVFLGIIKNVMIIVQILVPILLIIFGIKGVIELTINPEKKNGIRKIINRFLAAMIIFFIPTILNITMNALGSKTSFSTCWTNADQFKFTNTMYVPISTEERKKIIVDSSLYEKGNGNSACGMKIAKLAVELAGTASPENYIKSPNGSSYCAFNKSNDPRLQKYNQVHDSRIRCNNAYASCTQAAATIIDAAADPEINWMFPSAQLYYLQHSPKWQELERPASGNWLDILRPGDVGEAVWGSDGTGHSWIYVSNAVAKKKFPNTDGYIFEAGYSSCKNPHIDPSDALITGKNVHYFRFIGNCSEAETKNLKDGPGGPSGYTC